MRSNGAPDDQGRYTLTHCCPVCGWCSSCASLSPLYAIGLLVIGLIEAITGAWIRDFDEPRGRYILVTGCDSGFGHDLVLSLHEKVR